ncbi:MAG: imidazole glycerol phosphate synthase subunit HisH [Actinomycetota bacterium]
MSAAPTAGIVDYRMGNLASVGKALERSGATPVVSDDPDVLNESDLLVLPGVGNFAAGMHHLTDLGLADLVGKWAADERPLLGICMGMQMLFGESEEGPSPGLGILAGRVQKFQTDLKVPHMGWNTIEVAGSEAFGPFDGKSFYFVHSYVCVPSEVNGGASTEYGQRFCSAVDAGHIVGVQFHPEKSSTDGLALLSAIVTYLT